MGQATYSSVEGELWGRLPIPLAGGPFASMGAAKTTRADRSRARVSAEEG